MGVDGVLPAIELLAVDPVTHATAQARFRASLPLGVSFVDQVSLAVVEREAIDTVLVLDSDFARLGLTVIPPPLTG